MPQREYNDWYLDMMKKKINPEKPEGILQATRMCIYNCERNKRGLPCVLKKADDGTLVATCGIVHTQCGDERAEKRFFQEDPEKSLAGVRAEEDVHEKSKELVRPITGAEIGRPDLDALVCADAADDDDEANWDPLRKANMRLNQCTVWFNCLQDKRPGAFYLTTDEILTARRALRAVCVRWAQRGGDANVAHSASPIFWQAIVAPAATCIRARCGILCALKWARTPTPSAAHSLCMSEMFFSSTVRSTVSTGVSSSDGCSPTTSESEPSRAYLR